MCFFDGDIRELGPVPANLIDKLTDKALNSKQIWDIENQNKPNKFQCFETTKHIVFKFPVNLQSHLVSNYNPLWESWKEYIEPIIDVVTKPYEYDGGRTCRIMLASVIPGGVIDMHIDHNSSADVPHKIHVPLQTTPEAYFFEGQNRYYLERGKAYEVNNKIPHGVRNESQQERIHLIFDYFNA